MLPFAPLLVVTALIAAPSNAAAEPPRDPNVKKALLAFENNNIAEARRLFALAAKANPKDADLHYNLGVVSLQAQDAAAARAAFERVLALKPDHADARFNLGKLLGALGETSKAAHHLRTLAASKPDDPLPLLELATIFTARGDLKEARKVLASIRPPTPDVRSLQAFVELRAGNWSAALSHASAAASADPRGLRHRILYATALIHAGRQEEAIPRLTHLLRTGPKTQANVPYTMALARFLDGQAEEARRWLAEASGRAPGAFDPTAKGFDAMAFPTPTDMAMLHWYKGHSGSPRAREAILSKLAVTPAPKRKGRACHRGVFMAPLLARAQTLQACLRASKVVHTITARAGAKLDRVTVAPRGAVAGCLQKILEQTTVPRAGRASCRLTLEIRPAP